MAGGSEIILVDSSFFFALFEKNDSYHKDAVKKQEWLEEFPIIVPWPILYETINSKFVKLPATIRRFENIIRRSDTELLDDSEYRDEAYQETLELAKRGYGARSLVDSVLHAILKDMNVRISAMLTFDDRDFRPICASREIEIL
ncbi:MAG: PIN domain-containing protein [Nitrospira sp.]|nr:PIN domain-containing protein [Nitrospira sp.]